MSVPVVFHLPAPWRTVVIVLLNVVLLSLGFSAYFLKLVEKCAIDSMAQVLRKPPCCYLTPGARRRFWSKINRKPICTVMIWMKLDRKSFNLKHLCFLVCVVVGLDLVFTLQPKLLIKILSEVQLSAFKFLHVSRYQPDLLWRRPNQSFFHVLKITILCHFFKHIIEIVTISPLVVL